jgi:hypothetical protein
MRSALALGRSSRPDMPAMTKRKHDHIGGYDPWEIQIAHWIAQGIDPDRARIATTILWMYHGDLRPLREVLVKASALDDKMVAIDGAILGCLKKLIEEGRLIVKSRGGGRPRSPDKFPRDIAAAYLYEHELSSGKNSEEAFNVVARKLAMTAGSVRKAVTWFRDAK